MLESIALDDDSDDEATSDPGMPRGMDHRQLSRAEALLKFNKGLTGLSTGNLSKPDVLDAASSSSVGHPVSQPHRKLATSSELPSSPSEGRSASQHPQHASSYPAPISAAESRGLTPHQPSTEAQSSAAASDSEGESENVSQDEHWRTYHSELLARAAAAASGWPRIVRQPRKRSRHVLVDVCAACGDQHASCPGAIPALAFLSVMASQLTGRET